MTSEASGRVDITLGSGVAHGHSLAGDRFSHRLEREDDVLSRGLFGSMRMTVAALAVSCVVGSIWSPGRRRSSAEHWVTAWGSSLQGPAPAATTLNNATVRMIARVTIPGDAVRIRIDNSYGTKPLRIGRAMLGHRTTGATLAEGSNKPVLFKGAASMTILPGGSVMSDAVSAVRAWQDVAISLHLPEA